MRLLLTSFFLFILMAIAFSSCSSGGSNSTGKGRTFKGLYSFGPEVKSFKDCDSGHEYWVADSSKKLELEYSNMNFEKPYEPVYVEVEGDKVRSGKEGMGSEYDSTLVVTKLVKITKEIPQDMCN
jgi:copper homeostasis protein (lipoprotein)